VIKIIPVKCVVIGCLEETIETLNILLLYGVKPNHIISLPEHCAIKAVSTNYVNLDSWAYENQVPLSYVESYDMKTSHDLELLKKLSPDVLIVVGWQRLIPESILKHIKFGTLGFHGSSNFLPWGRGRSPINWSIIEGRNRFILHMFLIKPGIDDGDVIGMEIYDINEYDNCRSLYYKTALAQAKLITKYLPLINKGNCLSFPQVGDSFYYEKRTPDDGKINWNMTADSICRLIRAVTNPYPGAFAYYNGKKIKVWNAQPFTSDLIIPKSVPGEILFISYNKKEFVVKTIDSSILVTDYQTNIELKVGGILI